MPSQRLRHDQLVASPVQLAEDDVLRLVGGGSGREVEVVDDVLISRQLKQEVVGDG